MFFWFFSFLRQEKHTDGVSVGIVFRRENPGVSDKEHNEMKGLDTGFNGLFSAAFPWSSQIMIFVAVECDSSGGAGLTGYCSSWPEIRCACFLEWNIYRFMYESLLTTYSTSGIL
jgi:hypothetical protein